MKEGRKERGNLEFVDVNVEVEVDVWLFGEMGNLGRLEIGRVMIVVSIYSIHLVWCEWSVTAILIFLRPSMMD